MKIRLNTCHGLIMTLRASALSNWKIISKCVSSPPLPLLLTQSSVDLATFQFSHLICNCRVNDRRCVTLLVSDTRDTGTREHCYVKLLTVWSGHVLWRYEV